MLKTITEAAEAWTLLHGVFCVYKPQNVSNIGVRNMVKFALSRDLNEMKIRPPRDYVSIEGSLSGENSKLRVVATPSYSDNPLVIGPRYQQQDIKLVAANYLGKFTSGLMVLGVGSGKARARRMQENNLLRKMEIDGKFGIATDNYLIDGTILGKSTFGNVTRSKLDGILASIQASHQANAFKFSGVHLSTQEAYEIASQGIVRPEGKTNPLIYKLNCIKFQPPHFTIEIYVINESEDYLTQLIHEIGLRLKTYAVCCKIRSCAYGLFTLEHALLRKHWDLNNIIQNIIQCRENSSDENITPDSPLLRKIN